MKFYYFLCLLDGRSLERRTCDFALGRHDEGVALPFCDAAVACQQIGLQQFVRMESALHGFVYLQCFPHLLLALQLLVWCTIGEVLANNAIASDAAFRRAERFHGSFALAA